MDNEILLNANKLVQYLKKPASSFTRNDIIQYIEENGIQMVNFRYTAEDGRLKLLDFAINSKEHLNEVLTYGERVDGSSLFSYIDAGSSDLYVIPRYSTAFVNPFTEIPTLDILCSFYTNEGEPLENAPENILRKAHAAFKESTGYNFKAFGELEYYVIAKKSEAEENLHLFPTLDQKGYHAAPPFTKFEGFRKKALQLAAQCGCRVKYGHSEVGNFTTNNTFYEQNEIEFLPEDVEVAADQLVIAKWVLRMLAYREGVNISFAPKITIGKAGNGLHIHMLVEKDGQNLLTDDSGLTDVARKVIGGLLELAAPLTAFGNTIPTAYLRLVPHQEAPTNICWGDRNRSVLVRVPLGWTTKNNMVADANPQDDSEVKAVTGKQTVEFRSPDGSADIYGLLAGLTVAAQHGLESKESLALAEKLYVGVNIFNKENEEVLNKLEGLPASCAASAVELEAKRHYFEKNGIFTAGTLDSAIAKLKKFRDEDFRERLQDNPKETAAIVEEYLHCM